jgi:outer membrane protein TolC
LARPLTLMLAFAIASAAAAPPPAGAQGGQTPLGLQEALWTALKRRPVILLGEKDVEESRGALQEATGSFDSSVELAASFEHSVGELVPYLSAAEAGKRKLFRILATEFDRVSADLQKQLDEGNRLLFPDCPEGLELVVIDPKTGMEESICVSAEEQADLELLADLAELYGEDSIVREIRESAMIPLIESFASVAVDQRTNLRYLGIAPEVEEQTSFSVDLRWQKPFRNGAVFGPGIIVLAESQDYAGKPRLPALGGLGVPDAYKSVIGFTLDVPLRKGWGRVSTEAAERAAELNYRASLATQAHLLSTILLEAELAYWDLVAAQETSRLLERSVETQAELVEIGGALVTADELAEADLDQLRARLASTRGLLSRARQGQIQRRVVLAKALGLLVEEPTDAREAADPFPDLPDRDVFLRLSQDRLSRIALSQRGDLLAARHLEEAAAVLGEAAYADLKREVNLSVTLAYAGLHEGGTLERGHDILEGLHGALFDGLAGPSAQVVLDFDLPFHNRAARGRHLQAHSLAQRSTINTLDLEREIRAQTGELLVSLDRAMLETQRHSEAVAEYDRLLASTLERFALGEATTSEIVLTEELKITEEVNLVTARQRTAILLTQLRFTVGALLTYKMEGGRVVAEELHPLGLGFPGKPVS